MATSVFSNSMGVVDGGGHTMVSLAPDVCKTPSPHGPIPIPYPSTAPPLAPATKAKALVTKKASFTKDSSLPVISGDEPGSLMWAQKSTERKQRLQVAGFSPVAAEGMVAGQQIDGSADKMLLYSYITRNS
jgi:hypothetical protein